MKIFVTGASGYIGGTLAEALLARGHEVWGLVRSEERASQVRARGIRSIAGDLDRLDVLADTARRADATFHTAQADHEASARAMVEALKGSGKFFLHTSGAGIVADMAGGEERSPVYDETTPVTPLPARAPRLALINHVCDAARDGLRSVVVAPPMIYGKGSGLNPHSIQIPKMIAVAKEAGIARCVGRGANRWSCVHVEDLVSLYLKALEKAPPGAFYYAENGVENSMHDIASAIGRMLDLGGDVQSLSLAEAYAVYGEGAVNLSFGSNCRVRALRPRQELGWTPQHRLLLDEIENGSYAQG